MSRLEEGQCGICYATKNQQHGDTCKNNPNRFVEIALPYSTTADEVTAHTLTWIADQITDIRNQLWVMTDEMLMTRRQREDMEILKARLFKLQEMLRG